MKLVVLLSAFFVLTLQQEWIHAGDDDFYDEDQTQDDGLQPIDVTKQVVDIRINLVDGEKKPGDYEFYIVTALYKNFRYVGDGSVYYSMENQIVDGSEVDIEWEDPIDHEFKHYECDDGGSFLENKIAGRVTWDFTGKDRFVLVNGGEKVSAVRDSCTNEAGEPVWEEVVGAAVDSFKVVLFDVGTDEPLEAVSVEYRVIDKYCPESKISESFPDVKVVSDSDGPVQFGDKVALRCFDADEDQGTMMKHSGSDSAVCDGGEFLYGEDPACIEM